MTLGGLTPEAWDAIAGDRFYSTAAWLRFVAMHGGTEPGAAVSCAAGEAVATLPYAALTAAPMALYRFNDVLAERGLPALPADGLLVGPGQGYRTQVLVRPGADRSAAAAQLVEQLRERSAGSACVAMYVPTEDARALLAAGVTAPPVLLEADAWLELPDGGWDAWLATLPSKRRVSVRREVRAFAEAGYTVVRRPLAECYEQLPGLAQSTQGRYGHAGKAGDWLALLRLHVEGMGAAAQVALCLRPDGRPVGFCLYYLWEGTKYLRWAGFDYDALAGASEYFNLTYYASVMAAPELGVRRIHAGIRSTEAKALRGADLQPLWLLDLAEDSALAHHRDAVARHNRAAYERLAADPRTRAAVSDLAAWQVTA